MLTNSSLDLAFGRILAGEPEAVRDPYAVYDAVREAGDIYRYKGTVPIAASHAAVRQLSLDDDRFLSHRSLDRFSLAELADSARSRVAVFFPFSLLPFTVLFCFPPLLFFSSSFLLFFFLFFFFFFFSFF